MERLGVTTRGCLYIPLDLSCRVEHLILSKLHIFYKFCAQAYCYIKVYRGKKSETSACDFVSPEKLCSMSESSVK